MRYERDFRIGELCVETASGFEMAAWWLAAIAFCLTVWFGVGKLALFLLG